MVGWIRPGGWEPTGFHTHNFGTEWTCEPSTAALHLIPQAQQFITQEPFSSRSGEFCCFVFFYLRMQHQSFSSSSDSQRGSQTIVSFLSYHAISSSAGWQSSSSTGSSSPYHWPLLTKQKDHACWDDHEPGDVWDTESTRYGGKDEQEARGGFTKLSPGTNETWVLDSKI